MPSFILRASIDATYVLYHVYKTFKKSEFRTLPFVLYGERGQLLPVSKWEPFRVVPLYGMGPRGYNKKIKV